MAMEENSAALEWLITCYINTKHFLNANLLDEGAFINEMVQCCNERGYHRYSFKEIKSTWKELVSKYIYLKTKGSTEERENWKYFEILDSCYDESDFPDETHDKFSREMVWFLIQCLLKRKTSGKAQKRNSVWNGIHKDFLLCGYLNISKRDIENKWKDLNLKYEKLKNDADRLKKLPYLQALNAFYEEKKTPLVNMVFTKDLTQTLIECFTEKKVSCIINGYDSDRVLNEIQSKFNEMGFFFSKEAIIDKWRQLTNIYKFLLNKKENKTSWAYFDAMKNHFKDDYLFPCNGDDEEIGKDKDCKFRHRSKSVGAQLETADFDEISLSKDSSCHAMVLEDERIYFSKNKSVSRPLEEIRRSSSPRKKHRPRKNIQKTEETYRRQSDIQSLRPRSKSDCSEIKDEPSAHGEPDNLLEEKKKSVKRPKPDSNANNFYKKLKTIDDPNRTESENMKENLSVDVSTNNNVQSTYLKCLSVNQNEDINDISHTTNKAEMLNVNQSSVQKTIITKQLDNELLPFKKRLIINLDQNIKPPTISEEINEESAAFPVKELKNKLAAHEVKFKEEIAADIDRGTPENGGTNDILNKQFPQGKQQCQNISEEEHQENVPMQNARANAQNQFVLLDGSNNNNLKSIVDEEEIVDLTRESCEETRRTMGSSFNVQKVMDSSEDIVRQISPKSSEVNQIEGKDSSDVSVDHIKMSLVYNNISDWTKDASLKVGNCNSSFYPTEKGQFFTHCTNLNDMSHSKAGNENSVICPTEKQSIKSECCYGDNDRQMQDSKIVFRKPLPVVKDTLNQIKLCPTVLDKHLPRSTKLLPGKNQILISRRDLNKNELKLPTSIQKFSGNDTKAAVKQAFSGFKFISHVIKPATTKSFRESKPHEEPITDIKFNYTNEPISDSSLPTIQSLPTGSNDFSQVKGPPLRSDEFETESMCSEAVGDDGLKENLLATVIDFQEQNKQEFIEIKNLMKQNNLLQRETNRLLRLLLERM